MKKEKKPSALSRLMEYAGSYKILTYLSWILSFLSALTELLPLVYIFFIIREVLEAAPDFSKATSIVHNGVMAVVFSAAALVIYIGALMCSHVSAFRIGSNIKRRLLKHISELPLGFSDEMGSGKLRKIINDSSAAAETYLAHNLPDMAGAVALMPYLADNSSEIRDVFDHNETVSKAYKELVEGVIAELPKEAQKQGFLFCDSIYYTANRIGAPMEIEVNVPGAGVFPTVPNVIENGVYKPENVLVGKFFTKGLTDEKPKKKVMPEVAPSELKCKYTLNPNMSELEKASVYQMPDTYIVTPLLLKAVHNVWFHHQKQMAEKGVAPKNILLIGPPGSGKSEFAKAMASGLGLKATHVSLSANSDESFATGAFTPQVDDIRQSTSVNLFDDVLSKYQNIADLLDCAEMAPDVVYADITGKEKPDAAISDCVEAYSDLKAKAETEKALLMEKERGHSSGISYTFVESKFAQAIENGWLVTLEEFTNVRDSAVAILINQLMDGYQELTLPTGKVIHRHPNTVVVFACNTDENQTGELQVSTLSRLTTKYYIDFPNQAEMIRRVRNITGFDDEAVLQQMASVVVTLRDYIDEHGFSGVCGVREFAGWAMQYQASLAFDADSTLREAAMETIVPSASTHREEMDEVIKDVIDTMLAA